MNETAELRTPQTGTVIQRPDIHHLSEQIIRLADKTDERDPLVQEFLPLAIGLVNAAGASFFVPGDDGPVVVRELLSRQALSWSPNLAVRMRESAAAALHAAAAHLGSLSEFPAAWLISCPTGRKGAHSGCLTFVLLTGGQPPESYLASIQLLAALLGLLLGVQPRSASREAELWRQLGAVVATTLETSGQQEALLQLTARLRTWAGCELVAVGLPAASGRMTLSALSDVTSVDQRTEQARILTRALDECATLKDVFLLPDTSSLSPAGDSPILREALQATTFKQLAGVGLRDSGGKPVGALLMFWAEEQDRRQLLAGIELGSPLLSSCLIAGQKRPAGGVTEHIRNRTAGGRGGLAKVLIAGALLLGLVFVPVPFRPKGECLVQPVATRFVAARFDGILQEVLAQPGDQVRGGDVLARFDGREIDLGEAALTAERNKARKMRDQYLAAGDTAAAQVARLDELRLEEQLALLQEKRNHLTLASPVDGIVLTGDVKRIEGSPVSKGQTLFEVAPLETMIVELAIPEEMVSYLAAAMEVTVRFDAYPGRLWQGKIDTIKPKSQIRDNRNVFIAELRFANPEGSLRPGMRGRASVDAGFRPLGWIVLRKPWHTLLGLKDMLF